jgi:hypothetical protein
MSPLPVDRSRHCAVADVAARLDVQEGESLARRLVASVDGRAVDRHGRYPVALGALRSVRRRLDFEVPDVGAAADALAVDPRAVVAAERLLEARLTPPGDPADVVRISAAIGTYRALLDVLEADAPVDARPTPDGPLSAEASLPVDSVDSPDEVDAVQTLRVHLARLEADRAMAQLGFALYDIACRGRSGADG